MPHPSANDQLDGRTLNQLVTAVKAAVKINYFRLTFTSPGNTVAIAAISGDGEVVTVDTSWDSGNTEVDVVLTGYTAVPVCLCYLSAPEGASNVVSMRMSASSSSAATIAFLNSGSVNVTPDATTSVECLVIGV